MPADSGRALANLRLPASRPTSLPPRPFLVNAPPVSNEGDQDRPSGRRRVSAAPAFLQSSRLKKQKGSAAVYGLDSESSSGSDAELWSQVLATRTRAQDAHGPSHGPPPELPRRTLALRGSAAADRSGSGSMGRSLGAPWTPSRPPPEPPRPPPPPPINGSVAAVCAVIHDMLQMKYGLIMDDVDLRRKLEAFCVAPVAQQQSSQPVLGTEGSTPLSPAEIVTKLNAHPDLQFRTRDGDCLVTLCVESRSLASFAEVQREVRRMPGTARVATVVSGGTSPGGRGVLRAVALFREAYGTQYALIGRAQEAGGHCSDPDSMYVQFVEDLVEVDADCLRDAVALDPQVTSTLRSVPNGHTGLELQASQAPALRDEYLGLGAWLLPPETARALPHELGDALGHVSFLPFPHVLADAASAAPAEPTQRWMRRLRPALEHPDAGGESLLAMLTKLADWLSGCAGKEAQVAACGAVDSVQLHRGLACSVARAGNSNVVGSIAGGGTGVGVNPEIAVQAARAVGYCIIEAPASQASFARVGAVEALCQAMRKCPARPDVQRSSAFALRHLLGDSSGGAGSPGAAAAISEAFRQDLPRLIDIAVRSHPGTPDLQGHCARAMQLMASSREEWSQYQCKGAGNGFTATGAVTNGTVSMGSGSGTVSHISVRNSSSDGRVASNVSGVPAESRGTPTNGSAAVASSLTALPAPPPPVLQGRRPASALDRRTAAEATTSMPGAFAVQSPSPPPFQSAGFLPPQLSGPGAALVGNAADTGLRPPALLAVPPLNHLAELKPPPAVSALISAPPAPSPSAGSSSAPLSSRLGARSSRGSPSPCPPGPAPSPPPFGALPRSRPLADTPRWDWATAAGPVNTGAFSSRGSTPRGSLWAEGWNAPLGALQPGQLQEPPALFQSVSGARDRSPMAPLPVFVAG